MSSIIYHLIEVTEPGKTPYSYTKINFESANNGYQHERMRLFGIMSTIDEGVGHIRLLEFHGDNKPTVLVKQTLITNTKA